MVTAKQAYQTVKKQLEEAGVEDAGFDARWLLEGAANKSPFDTDELAESQWTALQAMARRRASREPLQYILGTWAFLDLELAVGPGVLVPRPETEEVCLFAAGLLAEEPLPTIVDLCSGSGALALGLQTRLPDAMVAAVEMDEAAYGYLLQNIAAFAQGHAEVPVGVRADVLVWHRQVEDETYDLIICNPPYVTGAEYARLAPEVKAEPKIALVPGGAADENDGLVFYRAIARDYRGKLRDGGALVFEIGAAQGGAVRDILAQNGYEDIEVRQDMAGHDRIAWGRRPLPPHVD
ncbi:peptide chain release factor N(5)-glutamine methyltransferase [Clostridia bacterium OttesenSCG-928-O13]|nr:peptide chain release factor N(5)-glutamine methyltransferase [Clostridia bacterium OttesenSCG-928-O13]